MSETTLHRVLKYAGGSLIEVVNDLTEAAARALVGEWEDSQLDRTCKCETLDWGAEAEPEEPEHSETLPTPFNVYQVENTLGVINVMALSEETARGAAQTMLTEVSTRTGSTNVIDNVVKTIDVHIVVDAQGLVLNTVGLKDLIEIAQQPFEDA